MPWRIRCVTDSTGHVHYCYGPKGPVPAFKDEVEARKTVDEYFALGRFLVSEPVEAYIPSQALRKVQAEQY